MDDAREKMTNSDSIQELQFKGDEIGPPDPAFDMKKFADDLLNDV